MLLDESSVSHMQAAAEEVVRHFEHSSRFETSERMTLRQWKSQKQFEELGSSIGCVLVGKVKPLQQHES
jgi:hypothetical protein